MNGEATAKEISDYLHHCPVKFVQHISPVSIACLLKGRDWLDSEVKKGNANKTYWVK